MDHALSTTIGNAEDKVFTWMQGEGYNRDTGSKALFGYPDWQEAWENWWDEGDD